MEEFLGTQVPERPPAGTMQKLQGPCIVDEPVKVQKPYRLILKKWVSCFPVHRRFLCTFIVHEDVASQNVSILLLESRHL